MASTITGSSVTRASGGAGYIPSGSVARTPGGGGGYDNGGTITRTGDPNTGGGGAAYSNGGSGVVILRYNNSYTITNPGGGLTSSTATSGSDKITTFTAGTGNIQFN